MKNINKKIKITAIAFFFVIGLVGPTNLHAATTPSLGAAATYGVLSSTYTDTSAATTVNGDVGFTTPPGSAILGVHTNFGGAAPYATAGIDQGSALSALALEPCTFTFAPGAIDLSTDVTHGPIGVYTPGVYCGAGAMDIGGALNLNGSGTYIFRPIGAFTTTAGANVTLTGASPCDIFFTPSAATTIAANTNLSGIVIGDSGITVGANSTWTGLALAFAGTVTTDTDTITAPSCAVVPPPPPPPPVVIPVVTPPVYAGSSGGGGMAVYTGIGSTGYGAIPTQVVAPVQGEVLGVMTPSFPNTGLMPSSGTVWHSLIIAGLFLLLSIPFMVVLLEII